MNEVESQMTRDRSIVQSNPRVAANRHRNGVEQAAATDLEANRRARINGDEVPDYVPLWRR